ncbi:hypothetical protein [Bacillus sp. EB600]|uniref:hypothetical protein n=1 Tax=Bacillus sp. EB600 TaxID=2806345 RepID=UPI00210AC4BA|nr:hypothetical protein [Bacillus sp. EB600]
MPMRRYIVLGPVPLKVCSSKKNNHVYEWEKLFLITTANGMVEEISIGISGLITSLHVKKGQKVEVSSVLATIQDDLLITGSE